MRLLGLALMLLLTLTWVFGEPRPSRLERARAAGDPGRSAPEAVHLDAPGGSPTPAASAASGASGPRREAIETAGPTSDDCVIRGVVHSEPAWHAGEPIRVGLIRVDPPADQEGADDAIRDTEIGRPWAFTGLPPARYEIRAWKSSGARLNTVTRAIELRHEGEELALELVARRTLVRGVVRDAFGHPVEGAIVNLNLDSKRLQKSSATLTDTEGRYRFDGFAPGSWQLAVLQSDEFLASEWESLEVVHGGDHRVDFELFRSLRIDGVAVGPEGFPMPGILVFLRSDHQGDQTETDEEGRFAFDHVRAAEVRLYARWGGDAGQDFSARWTRTILEGTEVVTPTLSLLPSFHVDGIVRRRSTGEAVPDLRVEAISADNTRVRRRSRAGSDGAFTVWGLYEGAYGFEVDGIPVEGAVVSVGPGLIRPTVDLYLDEDWEEARSRREEQRAIARRSWSDANGNVNWIEVDGQMLGFTYSGTEAEDVEVLMELPTNHFLEGGTLESGSWIVETIEATDSDR